MGSRVALTNPPATMLWVWGGLGALMMGRAASIATPWVAKVGPFAQLRLFHPEVAAGGGQGSGGSNE
jgi:hypothetical protein